MYSYTPGGRKYGPRNPIQYNNIIIDPGLLERHTQDLRASTRLERNELNERKLQIIEQTMKLFSLQEKLMQDHKLHKAAP